MSNDAMVTLAAASPAVGFVLYVARRVGKVAERHGRNFFTWTFFAFFLPIPAIVLIYLQPNRSQPDFGTAVRHF